MSFICLFVAAFSVAKLQDDSDSVFGYHILFGLGLLCVLFLRLIWFILGSHYSQIKSFPLSPSALIRYFSGLITSNDNKWKGHNPASAWMAIAMYTLGILLVFSGILMVFEISKETIEDYHYYLSYGIVGLAGSHLLGLLIHSLKFKDRIYFSMINGFKFFKKSAAHPTLGDLKIHTFPSVGILFFSIIIGFLFLLFINYLPEKKSLNFFGTQVKLLKKIGEDSD